MTEIKNMPTDGGNEPITVETAKVIQGMSLVFCGALTMLEALHPHVSLAPSAILDLVTGNVEGLEKAAAERRAAAEKEINHDAENAEGTEGAVHAAVPSEPAVSADEHVQDDNVETAETAETVESGTTQEEKPQKEEAATTVTADDITKVIVRKIKQDRSNNEKVGAILKTYGVAKVSELPRGKYEAFLTDISQL